ncbi:MAG: branched-chain amino acid ABC transporter permease [Verrucomicrobia bacterium]|nr:branched-chain amino acid ABC transporter permease [Verrucomicrobiota bacterium]
MAVQVILNGLIAASLTFLVASGFALILRTAGFLHFSHGAVFALGPYVTVVIAAGAGAPLVLAVACAVAVCALVGCSMEFGVYRPLRRKGATSLVMVLASFGLYIALENLIGLTFGVNVRTLGFTDMEPGIKLLGARITEMQLLSLGVAAVYGVGAAVLLHATRIGKVVRAVGISGILAEVCGVKTDRVILTVFALGSAMAGLGGIISALDVGMTPGMGLKVVMLGLVATVVGGANRLSGVALGSLLVGMTDHMGAWLVGSQWRDAVLFTFLLGVLLLGPRQAMTRRTDVAGV